MQRVLLLVAAVCFATSAYAHRSASSEEYHWDDPLWTRPHKLEALCYHSLTGLLKTNDIFGPCPPKWTAYKPTNDICYHELTGVLRVDLFGVPCTGSWKPLGYPCGDAPRTHEWTTTTRPKTPFTTDPVPYAGWVVSYFGQSCDEACENKEPCNQEIMRKVDSDVNFNAVSAELGIHPNCNDVFAVETDCDAPGYNRDDQCYVNGARSSCSARFAYRYCCCSASGEDDCIWGPPIDCDVGEWSSWGSCSVSCAGGYQTRTRVTCPPHNRGAECPHNEEVQCCNQFNCPIDCVWDEWSSWGSCSLSCDGGTQGRSRTKLVTEQFGGACYGGPTDTQGCNEFNCPVDCAWSEWSSWNTCTKSCNTGSSTRSRSKAPDAMYGGVPCTGSGTDTMVCNDFPCPIDCVFSEWSLWETCTKTCGDGTRVRSRSHTVEAANGGVDCVGDLTFEEGCNEFPCPVDCVWTSWTSWTECTDSCGDNGLRSRSRSQSPPVSAGGVDCVGSGNDQEVCNRFGCPVDCVWSSWSSWTTCSKTCNNGVSSRSRSQVVASAFGGVECTGVGSQSNGCNTFACPVDCVQTAWSSWTACSSGCGAGTQTRDRVVILNASNGGRDCTGDLSETQSCVGTTC